MASLSTTEPDADGDSADSGPGGWSTEGVTKLRYGYFTHSPAV